MAASIRAVFGKQSLYAILGVDASATPAAIKKAYFRAALKFVRPRPPLSNSLLGG